MTYKKQWHRDLEALGACGAGVEYARQFSTVREAYKALDDIDELRACAWLWWLAVRLTDRVGVLSDSTLFLVERGVIGGMPEASVFYIPRNLRIAELKAVLPVPTARDLRQARRRDFYPWRAVKVRP